MTDANPSTEGIDNLRAAHDALKQEHAKLTEAHRGLLARTVFEKAGLNEKHADLFLKVNGEADITAEAVATFVQEYGLNPPAPTGEGEKAPTGQPEGKPVEANPSTENLAGMSGAGSPATGSTPPSSPGQKMTQEQFQAQLQSDPGAAIQAYREGRVEHAEGNVFVDKAKREGLLS